MTPVMRAVAVPLVVTLEVATSIMWFSTTTANQETAAHAFTGRAQTELRRYSSDFALERTKMPVSVAPSFLDPYTDVTSVFSLDKRVRKHLVQSAHHRVVLLGNGDIARSHPSTIVALRLTGHRVTSDHADLTTRSGQSCVSARAGSQLRIQLPRRIDSSSMFVGLRYTSTTDTRVVATSLAKGQVTQNWTPTSLDAGTDRFVVDRIDGTRMRVLALTFLDPGPSVCFKSVWIGRIAATVDGTCQILDDYAEPVDRSRACSLSWPD